MTHRGCSAFVCIFLLFVSFGVYHNSLDNEFVFDDHLAIVNNADTDPSTSFVDLWGHDIWGKDLMAHDSHRSYRPLLIVTFKLLRQYFGLDARCIRIASILSHALSSVLVYFLGLQVVGNWHVSFASSLLFSLHPVHVESVAAVVNIAEPLSCIFFCATFMMYLVNISPTANNSVVDVKSVSKSLISWLMHSLVKIIQLCVWISFFVISVLFKETAVTVLGLIFGNSFLSIVSLFLKKVFLTDRNMVHQISFSKHMSWIFFSLVMLVGYFVFRALIVSPDRDSSAEYELSEKCENRFDSMFYVFTIKLNSLFKMMGNSITMLHHLMLGPLLSLRAVVMGSTAMEETLVIPSSADISSFYLDDSALIRKAENPFAFLQGQEKVLSLMYLHFRYFFLMVWPVQLSPEYAFNCIPSVASLKDEGQYRAVFAIVLYVSIVVSALCGLVDMIIRGSDISTKKRTFKCKRVTISGYAVLISVMLMVIPFIPAAGVFLRLGTLLAERLLYVPSIGFCFLLCIFLLLFCRLLCGALRLTDSSGNKAMSLFWGVIISISFFYALRTHHRNMDWKTDTDLFLAALDVCPNSAKLNLQVTKIYVNRGDYADAERHITAAKTIDPEFCDIWYQEALMNVLYYGNMDEAISKLTDSLKCVFTSSGALQLLQNIWNQEIQKSPKDYKIYERIADIGFKAEMYSIAVQYFQQGAVMATEQLKYTDALKLSKKTEKAVKMFYAQTSFDEDNSDGKMSYHYREMICNMYGLGGLLRSRLYEDYHADDFSEGISSKQLSAKKNKVTKTVLQEINRRDKYLAKALQVNCVYEVTQSRNIFNEVVEVQGISLSNYALTVLNMHVGNLSSRLQRVKQAFQKSLQSNNKGAKNRTTLLRIKFAEECKSLANILEQGTKLYEKSFKLHLNRYYENMQILQSPSQSGHDAPITTKKQKKNGLGIKIQNDLERGMQEAKDSRYTAMTSAVRLYLDAGEAFFESKNYSSAKAMFGNAIHFNKRTNWSSWNVDQKLPRKRAEGDERGKEEFHHAIMATKAQWLEEIIAEKQLLPGVEVPCSAYYWYAHALSLALAPSTPHGVMYDIEVRGEIREHLLLFTRCNSATGSLAAASGSTSVSSHMLDYAREQLEEIDFMFEYVDGELEDP